jgi:hypothetical protein
MSGRENSVSGNRKSVSGERVSRDRMTFLGLSEVWLIPRAFPLTAYVFLLRLRYL